jgi:hypothetical protein
LDNVCDRQCFPRNKEQRSPSCWVATHQLPKSAKATFYSKLDETLESFGFVAKVRQLCPPAYKPTHVGRPGINLVVHLKMIMVGFSKIFPASGPLRHGVPTPSPYAGS